MAANHDENSNFETTVCGIILDSSSHSISHLEALNFLHYRFTLNQALVLSLP